MKETSSLRVNDLGDIYVSESDTMKWPEAGLKIWTSGRLRQCCMEWRLPYVVNRGIGFIVGYCRTTCIHATGEIIRTVRNRMIKTLGVRVRVRVIYGFGIRKGSHILEKINLI